MCESFATLGLVAAEDAPAQATEPSAKRQRTDDAEPAASQSSTASESSEMMTMAGLMALSAAELRQRCRESFVAVSGAKAALAKRLLLKKDKGQSESGNWAAGTGFGGADSMNASDQALSLCLSVSLSFSLFISPGTLTADEE